MTGGLPYEECRRLQASTYAPLRPMFPAYALPPAPPRRRRRVRAALLAAGQAFVAVLSG